MSESLINLPLIGLILGQFARPEDLDLERTQKDGTGSRKGHSIFGPLDAGELLQGNDFASEQGTDFFLADLDKHMSLQDNLDSTIASIYLITKR